MVSREVIIISFIDFRASSILRTISDYHLKTSFIFCTISHYYLEILSHGFQVHVLDEIFRIFSHPNILPVINAVTKQPNLMLISQFMPYGSLYNILHEGTGKTW